MKILKITFIVISIAIIGFSGSIDTACADTNKWTKLVETSGRILEEVQKMPDQSVPDDLLRGCHSIAIFPNTISGGLGIGGKYGQGIIMVRDKKGRWSPPAIFTIAGASLGWQIGGQSTDIVLLMMSKESIEGILEGKFKLGVDAAIAAGPVGRDAQAATDAKLGGILSYSRTKGLFIGVKLEGDVITQHWEGDEELYGKDVSAKEIMIGRKVKMPESAKSLLKVLKKYPYKK